MIRETVPSDKNAILEILEKSGQFDAEGLAFTGDVFDAHFAGADAAIWLTAESDEPIGVAYCNPEPVASGTWNLLMLWVKEGYAGKGFGASLVAETESRLRLANARLLIVETSGLPEFETARAFYSKCGFVHEATIKNFFAAGDDKLVYTKSLI